jgi:hypothetical protein
MLIPAISTIVVPVFLAFGTVEMVDIVRSSSLAGAASVFTWGLLLFQLALLGGWVYAAWLMFYRRAAYPRVFIALLLVIPAFQLLLLVLKVSASGMAPMPEQLGPLARAIAPCLIWVPYMLASKRVRNTFVH